MSGTTIDVTTPDGVADSYLARPDDGEGHPGVLLIMDAFGLRPQIERMADRIAERSFLVLAPNVFYRAGHSPVVSIEGMEDPEKREAVIARVMPMVADLTTERIVADGSSYLDRLAAEGAGGPVAIAGYCMGGRLGWRLAVAYPDRVAALGCFHTGGLVSDHEDSPHLGAAEIEAELYLGFADQDKGATPEQIAKVEQALEAAGVAYRAEVYEGAMHGYTMADTPAYDEAAAERHFEELFARSGGPSPPERPRVPDWRPRPDLKESSRLADP
jgi:carboxymethylenebutenolidase